MSDLLRITRLLGFLLLVFISDAALHGQANPFGNAVTGRPGSISGNPPSETNEHIFDVSRVGPTRTIETPARFAKIWSLFRTQYALGPDGEFTYEPASTTPDNKETQAAFLRYVAANRPVISIESQQKCKLCNNGQKPAVRGLEVHNVVCTKCEGTGNLLVIDKYTLTYTGIVPAKPPAVVQAQATVKPSSDAQPAAAPGSRREEYGMLIDRIMAIGKRFNIDRDEFTKELKYVPLSEQANLHLNPVLAVTVFDEGNIMLFTRHRGSDWLFHDRFSVKVGEQTFDSTTVPADRRYTKVMRGGAVLEICPYPDKDHEVLEAIAKSPDARVLIRIYGSEGVRTRELQRDEKGGIRDAVELAAILKKIYKMRKEDGIKGKIGDDPK
jgi:hypothetical protein